MRIPKYHIFWESIVSNYLDLEDIAVFEVAADNIAICTRLGIKKPLSYEYSWRYRVWGYFSCAIRWILARCPCISSLSSPRRPWNLILWLSCLIISFRNMLKSIASLCAYSTLLCIQLYRNNHIRSPPSSAFQYEMISRHEESQSPLLEADIASSDSSYRYLHNNTLYFDESRQVIITSEVMMKWCESRRIRCLNLALRFADNKKLFMTGMDNLNRSPVPLWRYYISYLMSCFCDCFLPANNTYLLPRYVDVEANSNNNNQTVKPKLSWALMKNVKTLDIDLVYGYENLIPHIESITSLTLHNGCENDYQASFINTLVAQCLQNQVRTYPAPAHIVELSICRHNGLYLSHDQLSFLILSLPLIESCTFLQPFSSLSDKHMLEIAATWFYLRSFSAIDCFVTDEGLRHFDSLTLRHLNISQDLPVSNVQSASIASLIESNMNVLTFLHVAIPNLSIIDIISSLYSCHRMESLELGNFESNMLAMVYTIILNNMPNIRHIAFRRSTKEYHQFDKTQVFALSTRCPYISSLAFSLHGLSNSVKDICDLIDRFSIRHLTVQILSEDMPTYFTTTREAWRTVENHVRKTSRQRTSLQLLI